MKLTTYLLNYQKENPDTLKNKSHIAKDKKKHRRHEEN